MIVELEYDDVVHHGDDEESFYCFYDGILKQELGDDLLILHSNYIGDEIGTIKVIEFLDDIQK